MRYGEQRVEIAFLLHQFLERAGFRDAAVFQGQDTIIPLQQVLVKRVGDDDPGQSV